MIIVIIIIVVMVALLDLHLGDDDLDQQVHDLVAHGAEEAQSEVFDHGHLVVFLDGRLALDSVGHVEERPGDDGRDCIAVVL